MAEEWISSNFGLHKGVVAGHSITTVASAFALYDSAMLESDRSHYGIERRRRATKAVLNFVEIDEALTDEAVRRLTSEGVGRLIQRYAPATVRKLVGYWGGFMDYCRSAGWIQVDPVGLVRVPAAPLAVRSGQAVAYSEEDLQRIFDWCNRRNPRLGLLLEFLSWTGSRITETLALQWERDIHTDRIEFNDKVKGGRQRVFPLAPFPELVALLGRMQQQRNGSPFVFPWRNRWTPMEYLRGCLVELSIDGGRHPLHAFRATVERRMRERRIPIDIRARLKGHSPAMIAARYDPAVVAGELATAIASYMPRIDAPTGPAGSNGNSENGQ